jgi:hypothetical protein
MSHIIGVAGGLLSWSLAQSTGQNLRIGARSATRQCAFTAARWGVEAVCRTVARIPEDELEFYRFLEQGLEQGCMQAPNGTSVYAHLYFDVLHQVMKLIISARSRNLGAIVSKASGLDPVDVPGQHTEIEHLTVADRRRLLVQAKWLLSEWPERFTRLCRDNQVWSTWLLRDMTDAPWWFTSVVQREMYVRYAPFDAEYNRKVRRYKARTAMADG